MPEPKRTYEADTTEGLPMRLKKGGATPLPKRPRKRNVPFQPEPEDPAQNPNVVMRIIDHLKNL